jgi:glycerophosphoryl diester phosphodiesterase
MTIRTLYVPLIAVVLLAGCVKNQITPPPAFDLGNALYLPDTSMKKMEAIYTLSSGTTSLGTQFVCKTSKFRVSFFSNTSGIFMILKYGLDPADSSIKFSGFWRYSQTSTQGLVNFRIPKAEAAVFLKTGDISSLSLTGSMGNGVGDSLSLKFSKHFSAYATANPFQIYAHHGVQTTIDPPYPQNSLSGVLNDEGYGVNGIEYDIQLTKDHVPITIHNPNIDVALTQKSPLSGDWTQYTFAFLEGYIRLLNGEKIPSLDQCLTAFIDSTNMTYFWMDVKGDDSIFQALMPVVQKAEAHAKAVGRNVVIYADLPSTTVIEEFQSYPPYRDAGLKTMCELELQDVIDNGSTYWGPRYSRGLLLDDVEKAHSMGIKVISWTLNDPGLITNYLQNGKFDGFISDYPAYVVYDFYTTK